MITAAVAYLGSTTSTSASGTLGKLTFTVGSGYSGKTRVTLVSSQFASTAGTTKLTIGAGGAAVQIGGPVTASPDLNGNGVVDFPDFIAFAFAFGSKTGSANFNAKADLNGNGSIDFPDFLIFAQNFGKSVSSKRAGLAKPVSEAPGVNGETLLSLSVMPGQSADEAVVAVRMEAAADVKGYELLLNYDGEALELVEVVGPQGSIFGSGVAIQNTTAGGGLLLADVLQTEAALSGAQDLVVLRFRILDPTRTAQVEVAQAILADSGDHLNALLGAHLSDVRALPDEFSLAQNFPNPFNPETIVPFALPVSGETSVVIYNILGQEVVTLASGMHNAGFYRLVWDGKDHLGHSSASGVYFVRVVTGEFTGVRKMLLLK